MMDDPFECFGSSSDEESIDENIAKKNSGTANKNGNAQLPQPAREKENGVMSFHSGVEDALFLYVSKLLKDQSGGIDIENSRFISKASEVLSAIDNFCKDKYWMMHIGDVKGKILQGALKKSFKVYTINSPERFVAVELGTYCGYSAVMIGDTLRNNFSALGSNESSHHRAHLYSVEVDRMHAQRARKMVSLARLDDWITIIESFDCEDAIERIKELEQRNTSLDLSNIDFLFIDHDKDLYTSDLQLIEREGLLKKGSIVVADNVLWAYITNYIDYVQLKAKKGVVETKTVECPVEYSENEMDEVGFERLKDGIEITTYLSNP